MAFDQRTRNLLQSTITRCRELLDTEYTAQLQELYGIQPDGAVAAVAALDHLSDEDLEVARQLRVRINHLENGAPEKALVRTHTQPEHVKRVIREQAFTVLNRLAALRLCEERGLVLECVRKRERSEGFALFLNNAGNALGETHEAYRTYLLCVFDELSLDLGVLFDRFNPAGLLFPRKDALNAVLDELNGDSEKTRKDQLGPGGMSTLWKADETIGWIYQYYNDPEERKRMRKESATPRTSRELAVRNQFFTPRYVVEFLTDNTLGRIWYDMMQGRTALADRCRYLVRFPHEEFLAPGVKPAADITDPDMKLEERLKRTVQVPHRPLKDPREIRFLDPACGSMHFGLYATDLFEVIYREAWEAGVGNLRSEYPTLQDLDRALPRLIIEHNIHGIDIDPRAAQIANLALWLRAQRSWYEQQVPAADRPRIARSNVVCAEPMPGEKELLVQFVEESFPAEQRPIFRYLMEQVVEQMQLAGEAGYLLPIEQHIKRTVDKVVDMLKQAHRERKLFTVEAIRDTGDAGLAMAVDQLVEAWEKAPSRFFKTLEERMYKALASYADSATEGGSTQRRLFAEDAARGFALIDLCRQHYDVVVMNPPFGEFSKGYKAEARSAYPNSYNDILAAFVDRAGQLLHPGGRIGAITSRTCFFLSSYTKWREKVVLGMLKPELLVDLGHGVMDAAMVEAAAYVLAKDAA
jgi:hypothetical protein